MGDDNTSRGLHWVGGIAITCAFMMIAIFAFRQVSGQSYRILAKSNGIVNEVMDSDITMYEGQEVIGDEVIGRINRFQNSDLSVKVVTKKSIAYYNRILTDNDTAIGGESIRTIKEAQELTNNYYINKTAKFTGKVLYDTNNAIIGIEFIQK